MEVILPIGPEEWQQVLTEHSVLFPGRDVDGLRRKYTSVYRKKVPTGNPNIPLEVEMAKKVKYLIGDKAMVGGGSEEYDMANNTFVDPSDTNVITANPTPPGIVRDSGNVSVATNDNSTESNSGSSNPSLSNTSTSAAERSNVPEQNMTSLAFLNGLVPRTSTNSKGKTDIMDIMLMQMQTEAVERAHERRERAEDRKEFSKLIASIACGFMQSTSSHKKKKKKKMSRKRKHNILEISSSSSSSSSSNSNSNEEENNN